MASENTPTREELIRELVRYFEHERYTIEGVRLLPGFKRPQPIPNDGFGDGRPKTPDIIGLDPGHHRIVFGIVRENRESLDSEASLAEYNVFLDHNESLGQKASMLYVLMPDTLVQVFTDIITHYIHREYWHRIIPVRFDPNPEAGA